MSGLRIDTRRLEYFVKVVDCGSISRAAAECGIAQPALSQQLFVLEAALETRLLDRSVQGVKPTEAGNVLYSHAQGLLRQVEFMRQDVAGVAEAEAGLVSVGLPPTLAERLGVRLLERLRETAPRLRLQLLEDRSGALNDLLHRRRLDIALLPRRPPDKEVIVEKLVTEQIHLFSPKQWNLPDEVSMESLTGYPLMLTSHPHAIRVLVDAAFSQLGVQPLLFAEVDSMTVIRAAVREGLAATLLPHQTFGYFSPAEREAVMVSRIVPQLVRPIFLCTHNEAQFSKSTMLVCTMIREILGHRGD